MAEGSAGSAGALHPGGHERDDLGVSREEENMRNILVIAAVAVAALVPLLALRWLGLLSQDAVVVGFVTGVAVAAVLMLGARKAQ
jgi:uncharacterized membrane protein (DUF441 family)